MPPSPPFAGSPEFRRLLDGDAGADLAVIALEIARDARPDLDAGECLWRMDSLAERVRQRCALGAGVKPLVGQVNWVLFVEEGFHGATDDYYDPRNSYLDELLERKSGIPISLSVLYLAIAERLGLPMAGVNLPGHFVVRTMGDVSPLFVDPYHQGAILDLRGCERRVAEVTGRPIALDESQVAPCPMAVLVARMLRNLKGNYLRTMEFGLALPVLRRLVALLPEEPAERRDLGLACLRAGRPGEAVGHLESYLETATGADDERVVTERLAVARAEWVVRN